MAEEGSVFGSATPVVAAPVVEPTVVESPVVTPVSNQPSYSISSGDTNTRPDTIAEATASKDQLLAMYEQTIAQLGKYKGAQIPTLSSHSTADIQAALNTAQANLNEQEGKELQQAMMAGTMALTGAGAAVAASSELSQQANGQNGQAQEESRGRNGESNPFAALLRGQASFVALGAATGAREQDLFSFAPPAGLPELAGVKEAKIHGLGDQGVALKYGSGRTDGR